MMDPDSKNYYAILDDVDNNTLLVRDKKEKPLQDLRCQELRCQEDQIVEIPLGIKYAVVTDSGDITLYNSFQDIIGKRMECNWRIVNVKYPDSLINGLRAELKSAQDALKSARDCELCTESAQQRVRQAKVNLVKYG